MKRRTLLLSGLGGAGALLVGWGVLPPRSRLGAARTLVSADGEVGLNGWIKIAADGSVLLAMNRSEMGQGVHTALAMLVADELDVPLASVRLIPAGHDALYGNVALFIGTLPFHPSDSEPGAETRTGKTAPRTDLAAKVDGSARFGIDVRRPGQLYAVIRHCPMLGGSPGHVDVDAALKLPGVERIVRLGSYGGSTAAVAVVARSSWHAMQGAQALAIEWQAPPAGAADSRIIMRDLERAARDAAKSDDGFTFYSRGDVKAASQAAAQHIEALYRAPYLAHAAMEPINCTAQVKDGKVDIWAPTQAPGFARAIAATVAGVPEDAVTVHVTYLGGGFG